MPPENATRIALLITELAVGGAEKCLTNLAIGLQERGFAPSVISLGPRPHAPHDALVKRLESEQIPVHFLGGSSVWKLPIVLLQLRRILKEIKPQVLQTFLFHANVLGSVVGHWLKIPQIAAGIRVADPRRWRLMIERNCASRQDSIVCVSETVRDFCQNTGHFPASKLCVIPNGINLEPTPPAPADLSDLGITNENRVVLFVGRLDPQKGLDWIIPKLPPFFVQFPQHRLLLVGDGPQMEELTHLIRSNHLHDKVLFAGWRKDISALLTRSDMLILPSRWEGMPNVVLEAMAKSRPVVVTRAEGTAELLGPEGENQLVEFGKSEDFCQKMSHWANCPETAKLQGEKNLQRACQEFSLERMIDRYVELYKS